MWNIHAVSCRTYAGLYSFIRATSIFRPDQHIRSIEAAPARADLAIYNRGRAIAGEQKAASSLVSTRVRAFGLPQLARWSSAPIRSLELVLHRCSPAPPTI